MKGNASENGLIDLAQRLASRDSKALWTLNLAQTSIISASRKREISEAKGIICYLAVNDLGYSTSEVGRSLSINRKNAGRCALRGKKVH